VIKKEIKKISRTMNNRSYGGVNRNWKKQSIKGTIVL